MNPTVKKMDESLGKVKPGTDTRDTDAAPPNPSKSATRTMRAVTWQGKKDMRVENVPMPLISHPEDVIVKVTATTICSGSDLHSWQGEIPGFEAGCVVGHEAMGVIVEM